MVDVQLDSSLGPYKPEEIAKLLDHVNEDIKISKIGKEGTKQMEKDRETRILERYEKIKERKANKGTATHLDLEEFQKEADAAQTEYEKNWSSEAYLKRIEILGKFTNKTYFTDITAKMGRSTSFTVS